MRRHDPPRAGAVVGAGVLGTLHRTGNGANIYPFPVASKPDLDVANRFLTHLAPHGRVTFQTFDDSPQKRPELVRVRHGTLDRHADELTALNHSGAGIYVMVNEGDGRGRKAQNVVAVRALFVDLDGAPLEPVLAAEEPPHIVVKSSPRRWHPYWLVSGCMPAKFTEYQKALAARFNGDPSVHDRCRVMRIAGFFHRKEAPFRSELIVERARITPYPIDALVAALRLREFVPPPAPIVTTPAAQVNEIVHPISSIAYPNGISAYCRTALDRAVAAIAGANKQNVVLNRECFSIGTLVAGGGLPERLAHDTLRAAALKMPNFNDAWPWLPQEIDEMIDRGFADARRSPRRAPR